VFCQKVKSTPKDDKNQHASILPLCAPAVKIND